MTNQTNSTSYGTSKMKAFFVFSIFQCMGRAFFVQNMQA